MSPICPGYMHYTRSLIQLVEGRVIVVSFNAGSPKEWDVWSGYGNVDTVEPVWWTHGQNVGHVSIAHPPWGAHIPSAKE